MGNDVTDVTPDVLLDGVSSAWKLAWTFVFVADLVVGVVYWGGVLLSLPVNELLWWRVHLLLWLATIGLTVSFWVVVASVGIGHFALSMGLLVVDTVVAVLTVDLEFLRSGEGKAGLLSTAVVGVFGFASVSSSLAVSTVASTFLRGIGWLVVLVGLGIVLVPVVWVGVGAAGRAVAGYRSVGREASEGADLSPTVGLGLVVLAALGTTAALGLFTVAGGSPESSVSPGLLVALLWGPILLRPVGIYLDVRSTGLYGGTRMRYVYPLLAVVPILGYAVSLYYLFRRLVTAPRGS